MKKMTISAAALILVLASSMAMAAEGALTSRGDVKALASEVMELIAQDKVAPAFEKLAPHFRMTPNEQLALAGRIEQGRMLLGQRLGASLGHELVREESAKDVLVRYTFVEKRERYLTRWLLTFYRPADEWIFLTIAWDDRVDALFE